MGRLTGVAVALAAGMILAGTTPAQASDDPLTLTATLDGQDIAGHTMVVTPRRPVQLSVTVTNNGPSPVHVRSIRLSGTALALTFFAYDTTLPFDIAAHGRATRTFGLDLADLDGQAIGLLPASVELFDVGRNELAAVDTVTDVRGSILSVYGVFGIAVLLLTIAAWVTCLLALARHRLPANRLRRALRFMPAGFGTGLVAVVTLSVLRVIPPEPSVEIPIVVGTTVIGLVLGYLTPHPLPQVVEPETTRMPLTHEVTG
ncbi:hypothetical protein ACFFS4_46815 [Kutzneria kofuensis]|uniref:DUF4436 domain-containing protein n=1 Tax=Kutzneria kofuensis TaxID=103725 RepID=A0A7W9KN12_9PSEU|nr:hypothetical protein [Kutzneria kofuensis]MBB5895576.1 hypothetical protein [Kutzneria kofuensis]